MMSEWAVMEQDDTLYLNAYEAATYETQAGVRINVTGSYPAAGEVSIRVEGYTGKLALRIPGWSQRTTVCIGECVFEPEPGGFWVTDCDGELILSLCLDMNTRFSEGELECAGKVSVYRGPLLFGTDQSLMCTDDLNTLPVLDRVTIAAAPSVCDGEAVRIDAGSGVVLGDFYHLGTTGCYYATWLKIQ